MSAQPLTLEFADPDGLRAFVRRVLINGADLHRQLTEGELPHEQALQQRIDTTAEAMAQLLISTAGTEAVQARRREQMRELYEGAVDIAARARSDRDRALDALEDMARLHCSVQSDKAVTSGAMHTNADALRELARMGRFVITADRGRSVTGHWPQPPAAFTPAAGFEVLTTSAGSPPPPPFATGDGQEVPA